MKKKKRGLLPLIAIILVLVVILGGLIFYLVRHSGLTAPVSVAANPEENVPQSIPVPSLDTEVGFAPTAREGTAEDSDASDAAGTVSEEMDVPYESPVDFEAVWEVNPDVVAWLYIPGTDVSFPVLQHPTDNSYYLTHDAEKKSSSAGAIFIEDYNDADFSDMCTIIYGHRMYDGTMFGTLQATYSDEETFRQSQIVMIYLPDREIPYQVFAAVPFDNSHILYYHDFDDQLSYREFINSIYSTTGVGTTLVSELMPEYGDRLLILSTCLWGDRDTRYLILAKELDA